MTNKHNSNTAVREVVDSLSKARHREASLLWTIEQDLFFYGYRTPSSSYEARALRDVRAEIARLESLAGEASDE